VTAAHPPGVDVAARPTNGMTSCRCIRWHRPVPIEEEIHHIIPRGAPFHGPDVDANRVALCPTAHVNVHSCIRVWLRARKLDRVPTPLELRPYTRYVRKLAEQAMAALGPQADVPLDP
jgi:hypothetical protein